MKRDQNTNKKNKIYTKQCMFGIETSYNNTPLGRRKEFMAFFVL